MRIGILESRAKEVLQKALESSGAEVVVAPVVVEVPEVNIDELLTMLSEWAKHAPNYFIFLNGSGTQYLFDALKEANHLNSFLKFIKNAEIIVRGPKPASVLQKYGISNYNIIPAPYTSDLIVADLMAKGISHKTVVIQHYGQKNESLSQSLGACGSKVFDISSYRWELPANTHQATVFIDRLLNRTLDMVIFTSSVQVQHILSIAEYSHQYERVLAALNQVRVVSIGPVCSQTLNNMDIRVTHEVSPPRLYSLIEYVKNVIRSGE